MSVAPGYRLTNVGVIPNDWNSTELRDCLIVSYGKNQNDVASESGLYPILASGGEIGRATNYLYDKPSVLIGRKGTIDKPVFANTPFWTVDTLFYTKIKGNYDPKFLYYCFLRINWRQYNEATGVPSLNAKTIESVCVPLPPTQTEQEAIVEALSDADALIESLEQLIAKKRQIKQGAMQQLLTGRKRLPGFTDKFQETTLGKHAHIKTGDKNNEDKNKNGAYPFFVRSAYVERIDSYSHDCEAILVPGEGNIGDIFHYVNGRFDVHQRVYAITGFQRDTSAKFLYYYLSKYFGPWAMQNTVKATVDSLRLPTFLNFELRLPSTNKEQTAIAEILGDMDAEITELETRLAKARQIKLGMMQQLLTGRIRLVKPLSQPIAEADAAAI